MAKVLCGAIDCEHYVDGECDCAKVMLASRPVLNSAGEVERHLICNQHQESAEYKRLKTILYEQLGIKE